jgi:hypothetical protein
MCSINDLRREGDPFVCSVLAYRRGAPLDWLKRCGSRQCMAESAGDGSGDFFFFAVTGNRNGLI